MPLPSRRLLPAIALATGVALAACGGGDAEPADGAADSVAADATPAAAAAAPGTAADAPIVEADLDAYARALAAEIGLLDAAVEKLRAARTGEDTLGAMMAATEMQTVPAAAAQAGIDESRYRALDAALGQALSARLQNPAMLKMTMEADTSFLAQLPADQAEQQRAQLKQSMEEMRAAFSDSATYARVPAPLVERFRQRADAELDSLWRRRFELRARAAGLAR